MEGPLPPLDRLGSPPLDETDCSRPLYTSCVLLKFNRDAKAETKPREEELVLARRYGNKPYLLVLTAQDVKLFATRSADFSRPSSAAGDSGCEGDDAPEQSKPELPAFIANAIWARPIARVTQKATKAGATLHEGLSRVMPSSLRPKTPDAALLAPPLGDGEELPPDAVASHNIALSQLLDLQQQGAAVHVTFRRQRPSTKFMLVVRGKVHDTAEKLLSPWASTRGCSKDGEDVLVRSCVLVLADEAAAAELVAELRRAQQRLRAAVQWITRGLPLVDRLSVVMVAVQPAAAPPTADSHGTHTHSPLAVGARVLACSPAWGAPISVPAAAVKEAAAAPPGSGPALTVTLYTPKGPHAAVLPISQLMAAYSGAQELVTAEAQPLLPAHACQGSCPPLAAGDQLRVLLHARMEPLQQPGPRPQAEERPSAPRGLHQPHALAACAALAALLAAWLQLLASGGLAAAGVVSLLALVLATAAVVLVLRASLSQPRGAAAEQRWGGSSGWALVLLQASLVASADTQRVAAEGGIGSGEEGEEGKEVEAGSRLPKNFRHLVARHPDVLDENMAERFLVSYPSASKAYAALQQCVEWRHAQGMVGLLDRPHPKFATIKHRYPHAALGWSRKKDCLVTLDCYGVWKQSYDALKADGVTEDEMLAHLMLCFDFYFTQLDPRPLPDGESVNIVDLAGLRMSDAAGEAFRFISRAGGLLNLHFPLRLRRAFLINAPSWWGVVWRLVSPLIDSKTRELMCLYSAKEKEAATAAMLEWIDADVLPREYGGNYAGDLYDSELERKFWRHVESRNSGHRDTPAEAPSSRSATPPTTAEASD